MIKLAVPEIGQEELDAVAEVLSSKWLVQGGKVEAFENRISEYLGVKYAIAVSSGTAALHLALRALDVGIGDEVIVPDFTFPATANVVELTGAETILCDINENTYCLNTSLIEGYITEKTKAIMPVHQFGHAADMKPIMALAKKFNLFVIEDAACALGTEYRGIKVGAIGDIGCFSFHPRKVITTGEGGMVVTNNREFADRVKMLRNHGMMESKQGKIFVDAGFNYRMTDIQGALGMAQMSKLSVILQKRVLLASKYNELLGKIEGIRIPSSKDYSKHIYQTYHILIADHMIRDELIYHMKLKRIETNIGAYAIHSQPYYAQKYQLSHQRFNNSQKAYKQGLALPLHTDMSAQDIDYIVLSLAEGYSNGNRSGN